MRWLSPVSAIGTQRSRGSDTMVTVSVVGSTRMIMIVSECLGPSPWPPRVEALVVGVVLRQAVAGVGPDDEVVLRLVGAHLGEAHARLVDLVEAVVAVADGHDRGDDRADREDPDAR